MTVSAYFSTPARAAQDVQNILLVPSGGRPDHLPHLPPGPNTLHWELSIDNAKRIASQSNRLVLIEFSAPWCGQCRAMENEVFGQPGVAGQSRPITSPCGSTSIMPSRAAKQYRITGLPTTVIIAPTPQGEVLDYIHGRLDSVPYLTRLNRVAMDVRQRAAPAAADCGR